MNRQLGGKGGADASEASPLSLLVHAADAQHQRPTMNGGGGDRKAENGGSHGGRDHSGVLGSRMQAPERPRSGSYSLEDQLNHHHAAQARAEAFQQHHQGLFAQLRAAQAAGGGHAAGLGDAEFLQQNAALVAAQQQQQAAALALASDIRTAVAAAQLRQAAQFQNQDLLMARAAAVQQQLGALGGAGAGGSGVDQLHQELELQRLEELERRQLLAAAAGAPLNAIAARQQMELQEAHLRQEQLDRQLHHHQQQQHQQQSSGGNPTEAVSNASLLERAANMRQAASAAQGNAAAKAGGAPPSNAAAVEQASARAQQQAAEVAQSKDTFQKTPGSVVVPCRARGMPMDHNFKVRVFRFVLQKAVSSSSEKLTNFILIAFTDCVFCNPRECRARRGAHLFLFCMPKCWYQIPLLYPLQSPRRETKLSQTPQARKINYLQRR